MSPATIIAHTTPTSGILLLAWNSKMVVKRSEGGGKDEWVKIKRILLGYYIEESERLDQH